MTIEKQRQVCKHGTVGCFEPHDRMLAVCKPLTDADIRNGLPQLISLKGFIETTTRLSMRRYARRQDDSILLVSDASGNWMHNVDWKPKAQGTTLDSLRAYLEKLV
jgi:hypothetical protein